MHSNLRKFCINSLAVWLIQKLSSISDFFQKFFLFRTNSFSIFTCQIHPNNMGILGLWRKLNSLITYYLATFISPCIPSYGSWRALESQIIQHKKPKKSRKHGIKNEVSKGEKGTEKSRRGVLYNWNLKLKYKKIDLWVLNLSISLNFLILIKFDS